MPQSLAMPSSNPTLDVAAILECPRGTMVVGPRPAPAWTQEREWTASQDDSHYWVSAAETLAFGFQGHLQHNFGARVLVDAHESSILPAPAFFESQGLAPFYDRLFQEAKVLGLSGTAQPTLRLDPEKWRLQRAAAPELASVSERRSTLR